ncbi:TetR/AcrR family transcriptional regulator [Propionibacteriaceae bacterium Y1923]|uniref:TetR/AcrR family transcriptional regulator n=1 Tax=Aestuariimicrobium sp. Y1814 TaxID=3418742 RepID=UPI003C1F9C9B
MSVQSATTPRKAAIRSATDRKIARAALDLVRSQGLDAVTIENVAAASGVAKTTIYRRYKDRYEMLSGIAAHLSEGVVTDYPTTRTGLAHLVADVQRVFEDRIGLRAVGALLASPASSLQDWRDRLVSPSMEALEGFFATGVEAGTLRSDVDYDQVVELIVGGMFARDALRGDVPDEWGETLASLIWPSIAVGGGESAQ